MPDKEPTKNFPWLTYEDPDGTSHIEVPVELTPPQDEDK